MRKLLIVTWLLLIPSYIFGEEIYTLDSLRHLALQNNKTLIASKDKIEAAIYENKSAKSRYLPSLSFDAGYIHNQKSIHLLSDETKQKLNSLGETSNATINGLAQQLSSQSLLLANFVSSLATPLSSVLSGVSDNVIKSFQTSTYNIYGGSLVLMQPIYMGGRIRSYDKMTNYVKELLGIDYDNKAQEIIYSTDQAYWQVVSLSNRKILAEQYVEMLEHLDSDVQKMLNEGVITKANTLTVNVKLNEAEMALMKVNDGLVLSRMLLCQLCGLDINKSIVLFDEKSEQISSVVNLAKCDTVQAFSLRKDLLSLRHSIDIADENVRMVRSAYLPAVAAFGGYNISNPNSYNGFQNKFAGNFNIGIALHVPLWNWKQGHYRVQSAKSLARSQRHLYEEAKEKITLQINQARFKVEEAQKKLLTSKKNVEKADENLRYARVGFQESVIPTSELLEAQTAWLQARTEYLDAEIDVRLTEIYFQKVQGKILTR